RDSIVEDRLVAEASQGTEDQKLVEQLNLDKRQLGQLLLQPAQKISAETNQRIKALEGEVEKIESQLASGRDLLREPKPSTAKEVVLFANPDFDLASKA